MTCISFEKISVDKTVMVMHTVRLDKPEWSVQTVFKTRNKCNNVSFLRNAARAGFVEASLAASRGSALSLQGTSVAPSWTCGGFLGRIPSLASRVSALGLRDIPTGNPGRIPCLRAGPAGELPGYIPCLRWACGGPPWLHRLRGSSLVKITSRRQKRLQSRYFSRLQRNFPRKFVKNRPSESKVRQIWPEIRQKNTALAPHGWEAKGGSVKNSSFHRR